MKEETRFRLLPKGLILVALGGYADDSAQKNTELVVNRLIEFMQKNQVAIVVNNGILDFAEHKTEVNG